MIAFSERLISIIKLAKLRQTKEASGTMLFNSFSFLVFAVVFFAIWPWARRRDTTRWVTLIVASSIFYGWWDWRFLFLLYGTGLVDFFAAEGMIRHPRFRKPLLVLSMGANLGTLAVFKYLFFFTSNFDSLLSSLHLGHFPVLKLALPIGVSFYTFQSMSYTIDVYRKELHPARNVLHFFASLALFPHLVAGPIIRASSLLPQLDTWKEVTPEERWDGLRTMAYGFFKKMVIADNIAPLVNTAFGLPDPHQSIVYWWVIMTLFAFQIFCDFSGYSDIAIGLAKWMGYRFPQNFNHPYISSSLREFWTRWHISLSTWFKDYVYLPLGGNKGGKWRGIRNMSITMLISGFWHGAAWNFVIWGGLHALYLAIERVTAWPERLKKLRFGELFSTCLVLLQVWIAWVFFRAESFTQAKKIIVQLFNPSTLSREELRFVRDLPDFDFISLLLAFAIGVEIFKWIQKSRSEPIQWLPRRLEVALIALCLLVSIFLRGPGSNFIYFQF